MSFPNTRLRRLRYNSLLRELVSETQLSVNDLIYPLFVCDGEKIKNEIPSMPGQFQFSIDNLIKKCKQVQEKGIKAILIFGVSKNKDKTGDIACSQNSIVQSRKIIVLHAILRWKSRQIKICSPLLLKPSNTICFR